MNTTYKLLFMNFIMILLVGVMGCGKQVDKEAGFTPVGSAKSYSDVQEVICSDVDMRVQISLNADRNGDVTYRADHEGMEVQNIFFKQGEVVHEGDLLVAFKSDDIAREITEAENAIERDRLMYEHVLRLEGIYPSRDYSSDEAKLLNDITINETKKNEYEAWLEAYSIRATGDGVVTEVSDIWQSSKVGTEDKLISVNYSSGVFAGYTEEDVELEVGREYDATMGVAVRKLIIDELTQETNEETGRTRKQIVAHISDGSPVNESSIILGIDRPTLKDAICIDSGCAIYMNGRFFVYVLDENDIPILRKVDAYNGPNNTIIVESGLEPGERVVSGL